MANTPGMPDDDDILDLTEVVERHDAPAPSSGAPSSANPPGSGDDSLGADFGADLDALLDSLTASPASPAASPPAPQKSAVPAHPVAAPIENPTPAGHKVDPNESLPDADSADIDTLLAELGVDTPKTAPLAVESPAPEPPAHTRNTDILDELPDDIMAMIDTGMTALAAESPPVPEEEPATPETAPETPAPGIPDDSPALDMPNAPQPAGSITAEPGTAGPSAPEEEKSETPGHAARTVPGNDTIDLNELDALLDDMLATAPATRSLEPAPAITPDPALQELPALAETRGAPAPSAPDISLEPRLSALEAAFAIMRAGSGDGTLPQTDLSGERLDGFEARLGALEAAFAALRAREDAREAAEKAPETPPPAVVEPAAVAPVVDDLFLPGSPLMERVTCAVCAALAAAEQDADAAPDAGTEEESAVFARAVEDLFLPGSPLTERVARAACAALTGVQEEGTGNAADMFRAELEKMTASAAARVIREELRALADLSGSPGEETPDRMPDQAPD